jgi:16S rRNA (cytosine967-C5)-methyltransferase
LSSQSPTNHVPTSDPRAVAWAALRQVVRGAHADNALDKAGSRANLSNLDRQLATELVYGAVRQQRTLNVLIDRLLRKPEKPTSDLRLLLQLGIYQLRYMDRIPPSAAVNTTVNLAKNNGLPGLAPLINGVLRGYQRQQESLVSNWHQSNTLVERIGVEYSFPDWLVDYWLEVLGEPATIALCNYFNQSPTIDLRVNRQKVDRATVLAALMAAGINATPIDYLDQGIRLTGKVGAVPRLPGYEEAWWSVQDSSAQLVSLLLDPQPGEVVVDACAAPGGKTTHIAELMNDQGTIWAIDSSESRLKQVHQNCQRLGLSAVQIRTGDGRQQADLVGMVDRVLLDAPCSGLGTLHRRSDARWQKTLANVQELGKLQAELLESCAGWVKAGGTLVYATCTVHPVENKEVIMPFLAAHPEWIIQQPTGFLASLADTDGCVAIWPQEQKMDGFFMVRLTKNLIH